MSINYTHYNDDNIFAKILKGQIPCHKLYENDHALAFYDIQPQAKKHILVIPKGAYISSQDFYRDASIEEIKDFHSCISHITEQEDLNIQNNQKGYRLISNSGYDGGQEIPHFHVHILGGEKLGHIIGK